VATIEDDLHLTPRLKRLLRMADMEREDDGLKFTGTEHILIAILLDSQTASANILKEHGITVEIIRKLTRGNGQRQ
jgi:ATP-dependent Clp protease ATP-binding subunit ClpA